MRAPRGRGRISRIRQRVGRPFRPPSRFATLSQTPAPLACSSESHNVNLFNEMTLPICPGASPCRCNSRRPGSVPTAVTTLQSRFQKPPGALGEAWHESCSNPALLWSNTRIRLPNQEFSHREIKPATATKAYSPRGRLICDGNGRTVHHPSRKPRTNFTTTYTAATVLCSGATLGTTFLLKLGNRVSARPWHGR